MVFRLRDTSQLVFACVLLLTAVGSALASPAAIQLDLGEAIRLAVRNELNMGPAEAALAGAAAGVKKAEAAKRPSLSLSGSYSKFEEEQPLFMSDDVFSTSLNLQWALYTGGKISSGIKLAELGEESAEFEYDRQLSQTIYQAVQGYINLLKADSFRKVSQDYVQIVQEHLKLVETNLELGYATKADLLATKIQLVQAEQAATRAQHGYWLAEANLKNLLGLSDQEEITLAPLAYSFAYSLPSVEEATALALQSRPEVAGLRLAVKMAEENLKMAQDYWKPSVVLVGSYGTQGGTLDLSQAQWQLTLNAEWKFSDGGAGAAGVEEAQANLEKARQSFAQAENGIKLEIKQKHLAISEASQARELALLNLEQAEENYEFTKAKYELGAATNVELLTAESTLNQARSDRCTAEYDYYLAVVDLFKAMGQIEKIVPGVDPNA